METARISYNGGLRTTAQHNRSGVEIISDAPLDNRGKGAAFSPTDLLATSLGSCMLTIMGIRANQHNININGATATITKEMDAEPRRVRKIEVVITMPKGAYSEEEKRLMWEAAESCPVAHSLHPDLEQKLTISYPENE